MLKQKRTHNCAQLTAKNIGEKIILMGWVDTRRDHGGVIFIDLRDRNGVTQIVFHPPGDSQVGSAIQDEKIIEKLFKKAHQLHGEDVISIEGTVIARPEGTLNPRLITGEIEINASRLDIFNKAKTPPFEIVDEIKVTEELRLKYRYLDLRRPLMQKNFLFRHKVCQIVRNLLDSRGFIEVETPVLTKSTPEGARDYLVPSRVNPGKFYALPQSPQLFKQLLMVSGFDKYFQITKCFRDEDLRSDRQPEHTQIDMEMSFVDEEDIYSLIEDMMFHIYNSCLQKPIKIPFPRLTYKEAMDRYGTDKPDTRFSIELISVSDIFAHTEYNIFRSVFDSGGVVKGIRVHGCASYSRAQIQELITFVGTYSLKGLTFFKVTAKGVESPVAKFFTPDVLAKMTDKMEAQEGDLILFAAAEEKVVNIALGALRLLVAQKLKLIDNSKNNFIWITDFPLFVYNEEEDRWDSEHHPFTAPSHEEIPLFETDPAGIMSRSYDLVLNGVELASGSIRIHKKEIQQKVFKILGIGQDEAQEKFGFLLEAFEYGAPPHAGIALGLDRLLMLLLKRDTIRDVIAFPKTQKATCLMTVAPSSVVQKQLEELCINVVVDEEDDS